jgi:hypothetical protein
MGVRIVTFVPQTRPRPPPRQQRGSATQASNSRSTWHRGTLSVAVPGLVLTGAGTAAGTTWWATNQSAVPEMQSGYQRGSAPYPLSQPVRFTGRTSNNEVL